jgi:hypothetical protein
MDASIAHVVDPLHTPVLVRLSRILAFSTISLLAAVGLLICARRATGALSQPLSPGVLAGIGLILAALALAFRHTQADVPISRFARYALWAAPSFVLVIWAAAISLAASPPLGLVALASVFLLEEGYSWGRFRAGGFGVRAARRSALESAAFFEVEKAAGAASALIAAPEHETVTQHLVRRREPSGEVIEGWLRADLAAGQRYGAAHLAICPPLERLPECFAEQADGPEAQVTIGQVLTYGVRFDIKLEREAEEPTSVAIEFSIQEPPPADADA